MILKTSRMKTRYVTRDIQNTTNKFANALDQKTKDFAKFSQDVKTLEKNLPHSKQSSSS